MEAKLCRALMVLLALSGTAQTAGAATSTATADAAASTKTADVAPSMASAASDSVTALTAAAFTQPSDNAVTARNDSAEWAYNSSAPVDSESESRSAPPIDPSVAPARSGDPTAKPTPAPLPDRTSTVESPAEDQNVPYHWLDTTRRALYNSMWHSARYVDRWFGSSQNDAAYQKLYGTISPALLYTQYDGLRSKMRFNMNFPFPEANDRLHAFIGRFDPNEFITERDEPSGAIARTYGPPTEDQTLLGIGYHQPDKQGSRLDAGAGVRLGFPMDPYVKGAYVYERGRSETGLFSIRETLFWQNSEGAGETTRLDLERIFDRSWLARYTISATRSQKSQGLRGYTSVLVLHGMPERRAMAFEVGSDAQSQAQVQLHDYGFKTAYRQGILRRWLIMEIRASLDWPRDFIYQRRNASLGVGLAFELLIGTDEFLARPISF